MRNIYSIRIKTTKIKQAIKYTSIALTFGILGSDFREWLLIVVMARMAVIPKTKQKNKQTLNQKKKNHNSIHNASFQL